MIIPKNKPYRSKEYMSWLHNNRDVVGETCALCLNEYWTQLHHCGSGGGIGMKPSDLYLVRVCKSCADRYEVKTRALKMAGRYELLSEFLEDALHNLACWVEHGRG